MFELERCEYVGAIYKKKANFDSDSNSLLLKVKAELEPLAQMGAQSDAQVINVVLVSYKPVGHHIRLPFNGELGIRAIWYQYDTKGDFLKGKNKTKTKQTKQTKQTK